jgi:endogenous inhibitor of DNA gyrase (YacG/DUF329 family)
MRTIITKQCNRCKKSFDVTTKNRRKMFCSVKCSSAAIHESRKIILTKEAIIEADRSSGSHIEMAERLGVSIWTMYRRMNELGISRKLPPMKIRKDGYIGYTRKENHRRVYERHYGVKLRPDQHVHHINGDKLNNDIDNLVVFGSIQDHNACKHSLDLIAYGLIDAGIITFDRSTNRYRLTRNSS